MAINKYDLAAALEIAGLNDGQYHRLTAAEQRTLFGHPVFGKKQFRVDLRNQGEVMIRKNAPGPIRDTVFAIYSLAQVADACNSGVELRVA